MKRRLLIFAVFVALLPLPRSYGCINHYLPNEKAIIEGRDAYTSITTPTDWRSWADVRKEMTAKLEKSRDIETLNDLAVAMIHTGDTAEAIPLLEEIERTKPGLYQTATNMGTAYELLGRPRDALTWIQRGIEINPDSHRRSEWIHVSVLKAKLALEKDPQWLEKNRVLGMDFGEGSFPQIPEVLPTGNRGEPLDVEDIHDALQQQLRERLQFVKPPDEIVSQLLFDYASLTVIKAKSTDAGFTLYRFARDYAITATSKAAIAKRLWNAPRSEKEMQRDWGLSLAVMTLILLGSVLDIRQAEKKYQTGILDHRYVSFPPLVSMLLGVISAMWIHFSHFLKLQMPGSVVSMVLLAAVCGSAVVSSRKSERRQRQAGTGAEFSYHDFAVSSAVFAATWITVTYLSLT